MWDMSLGREETNFLRRGVEEEGGTKPDTISASQTLMNMLEVRILLNPRWSKALGPKDLPVDEDRPVAAVMKREGGIDMIRLPGIEG
jgi:hypothetical protein